MGSGQEAATIWGNRRHSSANGPLEGCPPEVRADTEYTVLTNENTPLNHMDPKHV